ncbi:hypothetical protein [Mycobacterium sp. MFM001]|uniref:hypothetical protein n=1 Tax=Mycobacterium sp. MFM001 TaxID=2049453 RepID=UPI001159C269|nr:hypothetical protein [Mycobacterium sp. MFM001]
MSRHSHGRRRSAHIRNAVARAQRHSARRMQFGPEPRIIREARPEVTADKSAAAVIMNESGQK